MALSTGAKLAIGIGVTVAVLVLGSVTYGVIWFQAQGGVDGLADKAESAMRDGQAFAREGKTQADCLPGALQAIDGCRGLKCAISAQLWATGCLDVAAVDPALCDDVPEQMHVVQSARWQVDLCTELGHGGDRTCQQTVAVLQTYCAEQG